MEFTGTITNILPSLSGVSQRSGNTWMTQEYVIRTEEQYPKSLCFKVFGEERIRNFNIKLGEKLTVLFDTEATEFKGKFYNKINCYNIKREGVQQSNQEHSSQTQQTNEPAQAPTPVSSQPYQQTIFDGAKQEGSPEENTEDDLPF